MRAADYREAMADSDPGTDAGADEGSPLRVRVAAYAVVVVDGAMLLAHWNQPPRSGWTLPGGGIDPGEDPADAAVREVREETGYDAVLDDLLGIDSMVLDGDHHRFHALRIVYRAHIVGGQLRDETDGSTDEAAWIPLADVDTLDRVELVDTARRMAGLR